MSELTSFLWIPLVILAQFTWAMGNFIDRFLLSRFRPVANKDRSGVGTLLTISALFGLFPAILLASVAMLTTVAGPDGVYTLLLPSPQIAQAILVGCLEIAWLVPYFVALDESDEISAAPLFQSVPIFGLVIGSLFFSEVPLLLHIFGSIIVIAGGVLLNYNFRARRINLKVILLMLLASSIIALAAFIFKATALENSFVGAAFWMSIGAFCTGLIILALVPRYRTDFLAFIRLRDWRGTGVHAVNEIFDWLAILLFYAAVVLGPSVMVVQATTAYQPIFIFLIGMVLAKFGSSLHIEQFGNLRLFQNIAGVSLICCGSFLIFI